MNTLRTTRTFSPRYLPILLLCGSLLHQPFSRSATAQENSWNFDHQTAAHSFEPSGQPAIEARLGKFQVPEDRREPQPTPIALKYVLLPATGEHPGPPFVFLAGGPGGSGIESGKGARFPIFQALRQLGDVVLLDQRGTGLSNPLPSGATWELPLDAAATREDHEKAVAAAWKESLTRWQAAGVPLASYNTLANANDIDDLRQLLGAERLRLLGSSYGTHLALTYLKNYPDHVESMALFGVEGPDHTLKMPASQQQMLEQIQSWIDKDPATQKAYPHLVGSIEKVLQQLEDEPKVLGRGKSRRVICAFDVQRLLASLLRNRDTIAILPRTVKAMEEGNFFLASVSLGRLRSGSLEAMPLAMDIASGGSPDRLREIQSQALRYPLANAIDFPVNYLCGQASQLRLAEEFRTPVQSNVPVLAVSGTADGRTPVSNAEQVLQTLPHGQHLIIENAGHGIELFNSSPEIEKSLLRFFAGRPLETSRISLPPIQFAR